MELSVKKSDKCLVGKCVPRGSADWSALYENIPYIMEKKPLKKGEI